MISKDKESSKTAGKTQSCEAPRLPCCDEFKLQLISEQGSLVDTQASAYKLGGLLDSHAIIQSQAVLRPRPGRLFAASYRVLTS